MNKAKIYELRVKLYLLQDIKSKEATYQISKIINQSFLQNDQYSKFHEENKYKNYTFNSFYPLEKDKISEKGNVYTVKLRTVDEKLANYFKKYLANEYNDSIKVLEIEKRLISKKSISTIYSITPVVIKSENGYWKHNMTLEEYEKRLKINLIKKYNQFFNTKIDEKFALFTYIRFENKKPIATTYKNITFLGDKLTLNVADNDNAQELAYFLLGSGLGELNSAGYGYINYKWL